jgi:hypothetical protein
MSKKYECFINYNNNRYDIVINDNLKSVSFNNIYNKIQEIIELIFDQKITFETHLFEVIIH